MNYRHAFHAGNFADVTKHLILVRILEYLKKKPTAFRVIDTHAGIGAYDLASAEAQRSPEWQEGVKRLFEKGLAGESGRLAEPYLGAIRDLNPTGELRTYPGSPLLARRLMREQDRMFAMELHPEDAARLSARFAGDVQVRVLELDGWLALGSQLPPKESRALVLVDPPFEEKGEWERLVAGLGKAHERFATGIYALWYPLKDPADVLRFVRALKATGIGRMLRLELTLRPPSSPPRLSGSGMIVVNPPYVLENEMRLLLPALAGVLGDAGRGGSRVEWIRGE